MLGLGYIIMAIYHLDGILVLLYLNLIDKKSRIKCDEQTD
jgi:hypothetical protein